MIISERKIHLWSIFIQIVFYASISFFLYSYIKTHGDNLDELKKLPINEGKNTLSSYMTMATVSTFALAISVTFMLGTGIYYFVKINDASENFKFLNKINGGLIIVGGLGIALFTSLYLLLNE